MIFKKINIRLLAIPLVVFSFFIMGFAFLVEKIHQENIDMRKQLVASSLEDALGFHRSRILEEFSRNQIDTIFSMQQQISHESANSEVAMLAWTYKKKRYSFYALTDVEEIRTITGSAYSDDVVPLAQVPSYIIKFPVETTTGKFYMVQNSFHPAGYILSEFNLADHDTKMSWQGGENFEVKSYLLTDQNKIVLTNDSASLGEDLSQMLIENNTCFDATIFAQKTGDIGVQTQGVANGSVCGVAWQRLQLGERTFSLVVIGRDTFSGLLINATLKNIAFVLSLAMFFLVPLVIFFRMRTKKNEYFYVAMLDSMPHAILCIDPGQNVVACNAMMASTFDLDLEKIVGMNIDVCQSKLPKALSQLVYQVRASVVKEKVVTDAVNGQRASNTSPLQHCSFTTPAGIKELSLLVENICSVEGDDIGCVVVVQDITEYHVMTSELETKRIQYERIVEAGSHGIWIFDKETRDLFVSSRAKDLLGYNDDELESSSEAWFNLVHPDDYNRVVEVMRSLDLETTNVETEYRILHRDGNYRWFLTRGVGVWDNDKYIQVVGTNADITKRKMQELTFEVLYKVSTANYLNRGLGRYLEAVHEAVAFYTQVENFFVALWRHETGAFDFVYYRDEKDGDQGTNFSLEGQGIHEIPGLSGCVMRQGKSLIFRDGDPELVTSSIGHVPASWLGVPLILNRQPIGLIAVQNYENPNAFTEADARLLEAVAEQICRAIERNQVHEDLYHQATHDALTGLLNREHFLDWGARILSRQKRDGRRHTLLMLDLNRFKQINDSLGHQVGDQVLIATAEIIGSQLREVDTLARLGGDEFAVLLENSGPAADVVNVVKRIINAFTDGLEVGGRKVVIGTSVGIVYDIEKYDSINDAMRDADIAMYEAKNKSTQHFRIFNQKLHTRVQQNIEIEQILTNEFEASEFVVYYQPIVDLLNKRLAGFEALVRWRSPKLGYLRPDQFLPIAEETGTISQIDAFVLDQACQDMVRWRSQLDLASGLRMSVNLSQSDLIDTFLSKKIIECTLRNGLDPSSLLMELTESALMRNLQLAKNLLSELKKNGVSVCMDDFGTGYSSLAHLADLPFENLKIDRSFLNGVEQSQQRLTVLKTLVDMSRSLKMPAVVEGIETAEHLALVLELGCRYGQGYYFAKPMSQDAVLSYIENFSFPSDVIKS